MKRSRTPDWRPASFIASGWFACLLVSGLLGVQAAFAAPPDAKPSSSASARAVPVEPQTQVIPQDVLPPELVEQPGVEYPPQAKADRLEADVVLRLTVSAIGAVTSVEVTQPAGQGFDESAVKSSQLFKFNPALVDGKATAARILYRYEFRLPKDPALALAATEPIAAPHASVADTAADRESNPAPHPSSSAGKTVPEAHPESEPVEVVVVGEKSEADSLQDSAEAVTVVDLRKAKQQTTDLGEVLARTPGVSVRRTGGVGSDAIIALNGLQGEQIGLFVDGVPLDNSGYSAGIANIPVNIVERVEIYRGVVPARFGLDALGGVINIVTTRKGHSYANGSYQMGSFGVHRINSNARYQQEDGWLVGGNAFFDGALNNYVMRDRSDPQADLTSVVKDVTRTHGAYYGYGGQLEGGRVDQKWARRLLIRGFGSVSTQEVQTNTTMTVPYGEVTSGERALGGSLQYEVDLGNKFEFELLLNFTHRQIDFRDRGQYKYSWMGNIVKELGGPRGPAYGEITGKPIDNVNYENLFLSRVGVLCQFHEQHTTRVYVTPRLVTRRARSRLETAVNRGEVSSAFELVAGTEYEQSLLDGRLSNIVLGKYYYYQPTLQSWISREGFPGYLQVSNSDTTAWGAGDSLRYKVSDSLVVKASYEYAIRLPAEDELFGDGQFVEASTGLKPERSHNFNLGPRLELQETPFGDVVVDVNGFWRETKDQIVLIASNQFAPYSNVADTRSRGAEGSVWWQSPGRWLALDGSLTLMQSINVSDDGPFQVYNGMPIPSRPYRFASWGARLHAAAWPKKEDGWDVFYMGRYVNGFYRGWNIGLPQFKMNIPNQVSHAVGITFATRLLESGRYNATFEVDNLTNANLFDVWGAQRPGRSFNFKVFGQL